MAGFEKTTKTPRAGRFPSPRRGPRRRSRLGFLTALDAARRPSPPRPQRGPRRGRCSFLRQSRNRHPCLHDLASSTAVHQLGFVAQTKKPAIHRCLRPRSRSGHHSCRPARALVPAALHRHPPHGPSATAPPRQLSVNTRRLCTCNQRPSTRSHRTVDNSLITTRSEYSTFLIRDHQNACKSLNISKKRETNIERVESCIATLLVKNPYIAMVNPFYNTMEDPPPHEVRFLCT